jgi:DNA-binding NarL/FixJ family response regulator/uncharacterized protein involved in exopolysaccharide biosynthesis
MVRILIVDDQKIVREALKAHLENEPYLEVVGTAVNSIEGLEKIKKLQPDVVLMDIEMPGGISGLEMTASLSNLYPEIKVIIITSHYTQEHGKTSVLVGAEAFLPKTIPPEQLVQAIRRICQKNTIVVQSESNSPETTHYKANLVSYQRANSSLVNKTETGISSNTRGDLATKATPIYQAPEESQPILRNYLGLGLLLNALVWILALAYLKLTPPTYTSEWGVKTLETDSGVEVVLPDGGKATSTSKGWSPPSEQDPRNDYLYIAGSSDLLSKAAKLVNMSEEDYQEPSITVDEENGIIAFEIDGKTPEEAKEKALAFHQIMTEEIRELRESELSRQSGETQTTLDAAREKLIAAQEKLSEYRAASGINTDEQIQNLTTNIEDLRRQKSEVEAQKKGFASRSTQLGTDVERLSSPQATDAYKLEADGVYKQYLAQYAQTKGSLINLRDRFTPEHPLVKEMEAQLKTNESALKSQAASVLGRTVSIQELNQITPLTLDPQTQLTREGLQQDLVSNRAEWQKLTAQSQELDRQIAQLEARLRSMSQDQSKIDNLKRDLQVAEAVFASTLAKLDLGQDGIYSIYPPLQLVTKPNLPEKPSNPTPQSAIMGGLAGSFLVTTGLALLWFDQKKFRFDSSVSEKPISSSVSTI